LRSVEGEERNATSSALVTVEPPKAPRKPPRSVEELAAGDDFEPLLSPAEVAERLGVNRETVYRLRKRGDLPFVRVGAAIRVRPEALEAFLRRGSA
jgi:excisionase family DNA binding protein